MPSLYNSLAQLERNKEAMLASIEKSKKAREERFNEVAKTVISEQLPKEAKSKGDQKAILSRLEEGPLAINILHFIESDTFKTYKEIEDVFSSRWTAYKAFSLQSFKPLVNLPTFAELMARFPEIEEEAEEQEDEKTEDAGKDGLEISLPKKYLTTPGTIRKIDTLADFREMLQSGEFSAFFLPSPPSPEELKERPENERLTDEELNAKAKECDWQRPLAIAYLKHIAAKVKAARKEADAAAEARLAAKMSPAEIKRIQVIGELKSKGLGVIPGQGMALFPQIHLAAKSLIDGGFLMDSASQTPLYVHKFKPRESPNELQITIQFPGQDLDDFQARIRQTSAIRDIAMHALKGLSTPMAFEFFFSIMQEIIGRIYSGDIEGSDKLARITREEIERYFLKMADKTEQRFLKDLYSFLCAVQDTPILYKWKGKDGLEDKRTRLFQVEAIDRKRSRFEGADIRLGEVLRQAFFGKGTEDGRAIVSLVDAEAIMNPATATKNHVLRKVEQLGTFAIHSRQYEALHGKNKTKGLVFLSEYDISREILPSNEANSMSKSRRAEYIEGACQAMERNKAVGFARYEEGKGITAEPSKRMIEGMDKLAAIKKEVREAKEAPKSRTRKGQKGA